MPAVLSAADTRLTEVRRGVPDAGGLVIATDASTARAYARILQRITGERPTVVLSDEAAASSRIGAFAADTSRWMVAVRMVSEGVDVPRLCVGVYATSASTPLFFTQVIGRFVRARRRGETASVFLPSVPGADGPRRHARARTRPRARPPEGRRRRDVQPRGRDGRRGQQGRPRLGEPARRAAVRGPRLPGLVRPGALRRWRVRHRRRDRVPRRARLHRHPRAARTRPGPRPAPVPAGDPGETVQGPRGQGRTPQGRPSPKPADVPDHQGTALRTPAPRVDLVAARERTARGDPRRAPADQRGPAVAQASIEQIQKRIDILRSRIGGRR